MRYLLNSILGITIVAGIIMAFAVPIVMVSCNKNDETVVVKNDTISEESVVFYDNKFDTCIIYKDKGSYIEYICDDDTISVVMSMISVEQ